jgi:hypothetical protein
MGIAITVCGVFVEQESRLQIADEREGVNSISEGASQFALVRCQNHHTREDGMQGMGEKCIRRRT